MSMSPFPDPNDVITNYDFDNPFVHNHIGKGPKGYQKSDTNILEDVCEALYISPLVDASEVEVSVSEGIVYLRGVIENRRMKKDAQNVVERVPGVMDVQNVLKIKSTEDFLSGLTGDARGYSKALIDNTTGMN